MNPGDRAAYIDSLELAAPSYRLAQVHRARLSGSALLGVEDKPTANVDDGSLVAFVTGVTKQRREDVLDSTLLAQLAATKAFDRYTQADNWYKKYVEVLETACSWVAQEFKFSRYELTGSTFTVQDVVLKIIEAIASGSEKKAVEQTLAALKALSDKDGRLVLFDQSSQKDGNGNFQIAACAESTEGVAMKIGAFHFSSQQQTTRFLWFGYSTSSTQIFTGKEAMTLNERSYAQHRAKIIAKLGKKIDEYIDDLPI
jgi:hypothetical protein